MILIIKNTLILNKKDINFLPIKKKKKNKIF